MLSPLLLLVAWLSAAPPIAVTVHARSVQPGELMLLSITTPRDVSGVTVTVFGREVPGFQLSPETWEALVGIDLDQKPGPYAAVVSARVASATLTETERLIVVPKKFPTRTLRVDPAFVNPSPAELARIEMDTAFVREVYAGSAPVRLWSAPFVRPVSEPANSRFGSRSVFNGAPRSPHGGTDFMSPAGTPVGAPNAGRVLAARDLYFTGQTVIIDHGLGVFSLLAHLSRMDVREGDSVAPGQVVGLVGATGRVTGPHLHWALRVSGARVDALSVLALLGEK